MKNKILKSIIFLLCMVLIPIIIFLLPIPYTILNNSSIYHITYYVSIILTACVAVVIIYLKD